jgi:hypothetical protein
MIEQGQDTSTLRFQWHSHVHMQAYFSGTDTGTIDTYANCDWMISLVANKREEFAIRLDMYQPFRLTVPTSLKVFSAMDDAIAQSCAREVQDKVSARIYRPPALRKRDPKSGLMGKRKKDRDAREALDNYPLPYVETDPETLVAAHYLAQSGAEARVNNRSMRSQKEGEDYGRTYQGGLW